MIVLYHMHPEIWHTIQIKAWDKSRCVTSSSGPTIILYLFYNQNTLEISMQTNLLILDVKRMSQQKYSTNLSRQTLLMLHFFAFLALIMLQVHEK